MGTWLQLTAMPWLVYRLTGSVLLLGTIGFLSQVFILALSPFAGAFADHLDKKKILLATQFLSMIQALLLAWLTLSGALKLWHIVILASALGILNAFDMPARQAFVMEMVNKDDLMNAIGLNSLLFNSARLMGPALAGILIASFGEGICFLVNGLSFIAVLAALFFIVPVRRFVPGRTVPILRKFLSGLDYVKNTPRIAAVLVLLSVTGLVGVFQTILMPVFVKDIYRLDASGLGIFMSAMGIGALSGTLFIASRKTAAGIEKTICASSFALGVLIIAFSFIYNVVVACCILAVTGFFAVLQMGLTNTLIQITTPDEMRGRVMGFFIMAFMGFAPLGSISAGFLADRFSAPVTVAAGGTLAIIAFFALKGRILRESREVPAGG